MGDTDYETLLAQSNEYLRAAIGPVMEEFKIGDYPRYDYHLRTREMWWSTAEEPVVRVKITPVGTFGTESGIWLWAWANPRFEGMNLGAIDDVREYGEKNGIEKLVQPEWDGEAGDGWEMTAIASKLLGSAGAYRSPHRNGFLYLVFDQPQLISEGEKERYRELARSKGEEREEPEDEDPS
jgi:hypothetical protein